MQDFGDLLLKIKKNTIITIGSNEKKVFQELYMKHCGRELNPKNLTYKDNTLTLQVSGSERVFFQVKKEKIQKELGELCGRNIFII
jgi:hypothetical protein